MLKLSLLSLAASGLIAGAALAQDGTDLVQKGAYVARLGDCMACHTAPGGKPYAGGLPIKSDLGTIYATNITPDPDAGIGKYSEADFARALRKGVLPDGSHLYPAMPYPSYAKLSDADVHALYAYLMQAVAPVSTPAPETRLGFPFNQRWGMMFWNTAFGDAVGFAPDPDLTAEENRGKYIVEGAGHCGSCHTPRGIAMQEKAYDGDSAAYLSGGELNGWDVPALRADGSSGAGIAGWSTAEIADYLGKGRNDRAAVGGEMTAVVQHSTGHMSNADLNAVAAYLKTLSPAPAPWTPKPDSAARATTAKLTAATDLSTGARLYIDSCGACHFVNGKGAKDIFPQLDGASVVNADSPTGLIHTILAGAQTPSVERAPSVNLMPGFAARMDDKEVAELASFLRGAWTNDAGAVTADQVAKVRAGLDKAP
ncbi:cytochrome c [Pseudooceanicola sp. CBS1P-1]|uniref:C-type cytochrome n=1 Tax=Pseudooceanicola albus TaxID=2692189 RepID=A0A6L7G6D1_9RHOB|nr:MULTISPECIES: cytochrome c [Pseudooceanicola]MBT9386093.1 cytochrome c [Pseudooceanicola endophyticus]MXN19489.1 c-type cytochrome [Pseudooceanicola albus]